MLDSRYSYGRRPPPLETVNNNSPIYAHSHSRTTSSSTFPDHNLPSPPPAGYQQSVAMPPQQPMYLVQPQSAHQRRSPSVNTFSTVSSSSGMAPPAAYRTSPSEDLRRSTSSRSAGFASAQPTNYVALLRKQKGTVWCDRAQYDDPRLLAQQRMAKARANMEVVGSGGLGLASNGSGRTSTGLSSAGGKVAAKIRHHGKPVVVGYAPDANYVGVSGVPLRLSATEVEGEDSDEDEVAAQQQRLSHHRRTGSSGRSSTASGPRNQHYRGHVGFTPATPYQGGPKRWSPGNTPERNGSLAEEKYGAGLAGDDAASANAGSIGSSGSSKERLDNVPDLGSHAARLASNSLMNATLTREKSVKNPEDLRRRGSVDERTMTLTSGRLYIANPD